MTAKKAVVLHSGGLDSTTLLYHLRSMGMEVFPLSVHYGQRHQRELLTARDIYAEGGFTQFENVDLRELQKVMKGSSQTDPTVDVPEGHYSAENMATTVVANRNMILLSVAVAYAISIKADVVAYAAHIGDHDQYPDCRQVFIDALSGAIKLCDNNPPTLIAPFASLSKAQIAERAGILNVPIRLTYSCYKGGENHCGRCVHEDSSVLMGDYTLRLIKKVKVGDVVMGVGSVNGGVKRFIPSKVLRVINQGIRPTIHIRTSKNNELICTPDHEILTINNIGNTTVYKRADRLVNSKYPFVFDLTYGAQDGDFYKGWIGSYFAHDGTSYGDYTLTCVSDKVVEELEVVQTILNKFNISSRLNPRADAFGHTNTMLSVRKKVDIDLIKSWMKDPFRSDSFMRGWVAGAVDSDGHVDKGSLRFSQSEVNRHRIDVMSDLLKKLNIPFGIYRKSFAGQKMMHGRVMVNASDAYTFVFPQREIFRIPLQLPYKRDKVRVNIQRLKSEVKQLAGTKAEPVWDITTTTGNFVANGIVVHNCGTCVERLEAIHIAGVVDNTRYEDTEYWKTVTKTQFNVDHQKAVSKWLE